MTYNAIPLLGVDFDNESSTAALKVLTVGFDTNGLKRLYAVAGVNTLITANVYVAIAAAGTATVAASAGVANFQAGAAAPITLGSYFWARAKNTGV